MQPLTVETAIQLCREHLDSTGTRGTEIESILTRYLLVGICAAFEKQIKQMVSERAAKAQDVELRSFVDNTMKSFRSLKVDDIKGNILGKFSDSYKFTFRDKLEKNFEAEARYMNIVIARHQHAHGETINVTFDELIISYEKAKEVLVALKESLGLV